MLRSPTALRRYITARAITQSSASAQQHSQNARQHSEQAHAKSQQQKYVKRARICAICTIMAAIGAITSISRDPTTPRPLLLSRRPPRLSRPEVRVVGELR